MATFSSERKHAKRTEFMGCIESEGRRAGVGGQRYSYQSFASLRTQQQPRHSAARRAPAMHLGSPALNLVDLAMVEDRFWNSSSHSCCSFCFCLWVLSHPRGSSSVAYTIISRSTKASRRSHLSATDIKILPETGDNILKFSMAKHGFMSATCVSCPLLQGM